jgi:hypothetical protein
MHDAIIPVSDVDRAKEFCTRLGCTHRNYSAGKNTGCDCGFFTVYTVVDETGIHSPLSSVDRKLVRVRLDSGRRF